MAKQSLIALVLRAQTPYSLRVDKDGQRFFLAVNGNTGNQYGSMDKETALRVYKQYRGAWTSGGAS